MHQPAIDEDELVQRPCTVIGHHNHRSMFGEMSQDFTQYRVSLLEDAQFRAYAGLYRTYMLPNDDPGLDTRLEQLINAIKLVYASTYFQGPKAFSKRVGHRTEEEKMAVIIQQQKENL